MFLEISQNLQENTCPKVSFLIKLQAEAEVFSCEFYEISENSFSYRTPPVAASVFGRSGFIEARFYARLVSKL